MKTLKTLLPFLFLSVMLSCSNDTDEQTKADQSSTVVSTEISQIRSALESKDFKSVEEAAAYTNSLINNIKPTSRAINEDDYLEKMSPEVMQVIESMKDVKVDTDSSPEVLRFQLKKIINDSKLSKESQEYTLLINSVDIAIEAIYYSMNLEAPQATTRGFWGSLRSL